MAAVRFTGFSPFAFRLLASLARHNDRAWFATRKERIELELIEPMRALVRDTTDAFAAKRIPLEGDPIRSVFRIYRDVRFGHDKRPYRESMAAYFSRDGGRQTPGGIYVHVAPGNVFLALAMYRLAPPVLAKLRAEIAARPGGFAAVRKSLAKAGLAIEGPDASDDSLARVARGYERFAQDELAPYFRLRSFVVRRTLTDEDAQSETFVDRIVTLACDGRPLLEYGWQR